MNSNFDAILKKAKKKKTIDPSALTNVNIIIATEYDEWQKKVINFLSEHKLTKEDNKKADWKGFVTKVMTEETTDVEDKKKKKQIISKAYQFASSMMVPKI